MPGTRQPAQVSSPEASALSQPNAGRPPDPPLPTPSRGDRRGPPHGSDVRLLVVEDNPVNQQVALTMLETLGYTAEVAENGRHALELWEQQSYSLILMDCSMPELDGYATARAIRTQEAAATGPQPHIPIIALTANALEEDQEQSRAAGMDDYLSKPFSLDDLQTVLQRWLPYERAD